MTCPSKRTPTPGVMKFIIKVDHSVIISTIYLVNCATKARLVEFLAFGIKILC